MTTRLRFLGASCFEVVGPHHRILLEPFLTENPVSPYTVGTIPAPDLILVSHGAWDHCADAGAVAKRTGAPVCCGADVAALLADQDIPEDQVRPVIWGLCYEFDGFLVRPVECHHWSSVTLANGSRITGTPLSFIIETEPGVRIYHFGDTAIFGDMKLIGQLHRPTVALLGCANTDGLPDPGTGLACTGEMNPDEAALAAEWLGVRYAVATHYMNPGEEVNEFRRRVAHHDTTGRRMALAPRAGDWIEIEPVETGPDHPSLLWGGTSPEFDLTRVPTR